MRFLANENFPGDAVTALQAAGHDVVWVRTAEPGTEDEPGRRGIGSQKSVRTSVHAAVKLARLRAGWSRKSKLCPKMNA